MEKWIGRCGHGVAGGVGATGLAEKYRTAGGGFAGVCADHRQDKSRRAAASDAGKQAKAAGRLREEKGREEKGSRRVGADARFATMRQRANRCLTVPGWRCLI